MSDPTDFSKVIEDVLANTFEGDGDENHRSGHGKYSFRQAYQDPQRSAIRPETNRNDPADGDQQEHEEQYEDTDYNKQLEHLLGQVESNGEAQHEHEDQAHHHDEHEEDYQIDFANVVQGIMDHIGGEDEQQHQSEDLVQDHKEEDHDPIPREQEQPLPTEVHSHESHIESHHDDVSKEVNDIISKHESDLKAQESEEEQNFEDMLAQLANEVVDKVHNEMESKESEKSAEEKQEKNAVATDSPVATSVSNNKVETEDDVHERELQEAISEALKSTNLESDAFHVVPESKIHQANEEKITPKVIKQQQQQYKITTPAPSAHTSTLPPPQRAQTATSKPKATVPPVVKETPKKTQVPKRQPAPKQATLPKPRTQSQQHQPPQTGAAPSLSDQLPENFLSELDQLAGESEQTDDLQAALAQMVKNVVEGHDMGDLSSDSSDASSSEGEEENAASVQVDQSAMNDILHNAFQLAMEQQTSGQDAMKDVDLIKHKAALDDAISSLFSADKPKQAKAIAKAKKEIASAAATKKKQEAAQKPAMKVLKDAAPKPARKPYTKKAQTVPSAPIQEQRSVSSGPVAAAAPPPKPQTPMEPLKIIPMHEPTQKARQQQQAATGSNAFRHPPSAAASQKPVEKQAQSQPLKISQSIAHSQQSQPKQPAQQKANAKPASTVPAAARVPGASEPIKSASPTIEEPSKKDKSKLSIAETLALTRSSMKSGPQRDYSNISTLDQAIKTSEKRSSVSPQPSVPKSASKPPGVTTFQSNTKLNSSLSDAIKQMSNALQTPNSEKPSTPKAPETAISSGKESREKNLLDALNSAKEFISKHQETSTKETIDAINWAIDNLKKTALQSSTDAQKEGGSSFSFSHATTSSMTAAITQAISSITGSMGSARAKTSAKKPKVKIEGPELKEKIRQSNRERKKRWREINAERNKDNDLKFRVTKRATQLFGEEETEAKKKWMEVELEKRRKKRLQRFSHSLRQLESYDQSDDSSKPITSVIQPKKETSNNPLLKTFLDALGQRNINSSAATAAISNAINNANLSDPNLTASLTNIISSIVNTHTASPSTQQPLEKTTAQPVVAAPPSTAPDKELTDIVRGTKTTAAQNMANSFENLKIKSDSSSYTTSIPEKRKSDVDEKALSNDSKKPRSVSPSPVTEFKNSANPENTAPVSVPKPAVSAISRKLGQSPAIGQPAPGISDPFRAALSSRMAFKLPQYKRPGSVAPNNTSRSPVPHYASSPSPQNPQSTSSTPSKDPLSESPVASPRRPLQRPNFSKPPAFQRPRW